MKKFYVFLCLSVLFIINVNAQNSREYIRSRIREWGECKNVAITQYNGDLALYGRNGWSGSGLPSGLREALSELNDENKLIDDVQLTENGSWLILVGNNGFRWHNIPYGLERKLYEFHDRNEVVTSVTFNDDGDWIIVGQDHYSSSSTWIQDWLKEGADKFGVLWAVCVTTDAMVACYESGYRYYGNVPYDLKEALRETNINVFRIKIAGTAWFFSDNDGRYRYNM